MTSIRLIIFLLLVFVYGSVHSQDTTKTFFPSGHVKLLRVKIDSNTMYEKEFYENGQILSDGYIRFLMGKWRLLNTKVYYENGALKVSACDTSITMYDMDGQIYMHEQTINGIRNGLQYLYLGGQLFSITEFKNDKKDGEYTGYNSKGKVDTKETYKEDMREGISEYFDSVGHITQKRVYKNNIPIKVTYYDKNGKVVKITDGSKEYAEEKKIHNFSKEIFSNQ